MKQFLLLAGLLTSIASTAQEGGTISTDRPSQSAGSSLVPAGSFQIETGLILEKDGSLNGSNFNTLIRFGVNEFLELRFQQDYLGNDLGMEKVSGLSATRIGLKSVIAKEKGWMPEMALVGNITLPSGESIYQTRNTTPDFRFAVSKGISDKVTIGYNLGTQWDTDSPKSTTFYTLIVAVSFSDKFGGFFEPYGFVRKEQQADSRLNGGFTYLLTSNMQVDLTAGVGLTDEAPDSFIAFGYSVVF